MRFGLILSLWSWVSIVGASKSKQRRDKSVDSDANVGVSPIDLPKHFLFDNTKETEHIVEVKSKRLDFSVAPTVKPRIVLFYSPSRRASTSYKDKYVDLARTIHEKYGKKVSIYAVSCKARKLICQAYGISAWPTLKLTTDNGESWHQLENTLALEQLEKFLASSTGFGSKTEDNETPKTDPKQASGEKEESQAELPKLEPSNKVFADKQYLPSMESSRSQKTSDHSRQLSAQLEGQSVEKDNEQREAKDDSGKEPDLSPPVDPDHANDEKRAPLDEDNEEMETEGKQAKNDDDEVEEQKPKPKSAINNEDGDQSDDENEGQPDKDDVEEGDEELLRNDKGNSDDEDEYEEKGEEDEPESDQIADEEDGGDDVESEDEENDKKFPHEAAPNSPSPGAAKARMGRYEMDLQGAIKDGLVGKPTRLGYLVSRPKHYKTLSRLKGSMEAEETETMAAHKPFSPEFLARRQAILDRIEKKKGRAVRRKVEQRWNQIQNSAGRLKLPFRKEVSRKRFVENLPLVKRVARLLPEEELMLDTSLSFVHGMRYGVYRSPGPLSPQKTRALMDWLEFLSATLPEEWGIHDLIDNLLENSKFIVRGEKNLIEILDQHHMNRKQWSPSCTKHSSASPGFRCGFWKLLHTASIGLAQHRGGQTLINIGLRKPDARVFSPSEGAAVIRDYMEQFFTCSVCVTNFLKTYDDCSKNRRCDRLAKDARSANDADWKEMGKWLWEVHNDVNVRLVLERADRKRQGMRFTEAQNSKAPATIAALWPSFDDCVACFHADGSWNDNAVFVYLELEYWPHDHPKMGRLLQLDEEYDTFEFGLFWILFIAGVILAYYLNQNKVALQKTMLNVRQMQASVAKPLAAKAAVQKRSN